MSQRSYEDGCGAALALDVIGERWALHVVRELIFGPKRFRDLRNALPQASQNVLSQRLRELEQDGVIRRVEVGPPVSARVYELTDSGRDLEPVLISLARWGAHRAGPKSAEMSTDAFMLLLKTLYRPPAHQAPSLSIRLVVGLDAFDVTVTPSEVDVVRGARAAVQATVRADVPTLWALIFADRTVASAVDAGDVELTGDGEAAQQFFRLFGL
ncbi:transcriptional regulator [Sphaerisporangium melleum]|uniref:Transcriptional regulator n=1 Tax=Sphaerisporangium melleum TaxID=321316 RepID=A0A917VQU0_9ACTN|nr:helix-turn-helix domain-containing protein [Sphaerisporangium melleum]GGL05317.1 transcriptional regulator [Sphaerisporangium melleum]GII73903.1 transcriptional regulator [Sphaerisporangium melleum]